FDCKSFDPAGVVVVACGDGHRLPEIVTFHRRLAETNGGDATPNGCCTHFVTLNGGALLLATESPVANQGLQEDRVVYNHIRAAISLKRLDTNGARPTVLLYTHAPCGAAAIHHLDLVEQMELVTGAKIRLKNRHRDWRVICCVHIDFPAEGKKPGKGRSYTFSTKDFLKYMRLEFSRSIIQTIRLRHGLESADR
ncbi:MAG: hypothetical protein AAB849_02515, partial [Patescibacteria group bacterium]